MFLRQDFAGDERKPPRSHRRIPRWIVSEATVPRVQRSYAVRPQRIAPLEIGPSKPDLRVGISRSKGIHPGEAKLAGTVQAPDPWPDTVRKASEAPDLDAAWRLLTDALRLPVVRSSGEWRNQPDPDPVIWLRSCTVRTDAVLSSGEVAVLSGAGKSGKSYIGVAVTRVIARSR